MVAIISLIIFVVTYTVMKILSRIYTSSPKTYTFESISNVLEPLIKYTLIIFIIPSYIITLSLTGLSKSYKSVSTMCEEKAVKLLPEAKKQLMLHYGNRFSNMNITLNNIDGYTNYRPDSVSSQAALKVIEYRKESLSAKKKSLFFLSIVKTFNGSSIFFTYR